MMNAQKARTSQAPALWTPWGAMPAPPPSAEVGSREPATARAGRSRREWIAKVAKKSKP